MQVKQIYLTSQDLDPCCDRLVHADDPPPWRNYRSKPTADLKPRTPRIMDYEQAARGRAYRSTPEVAKCVDAALFLRRPLLVAGQAGVGKSTLAYSIAYQLGLGNVLRWGVTSQTTLRDGLYEYDAIARLQDYQSQNFPPRKNGSYFGKQESTGPDIGNYITLGPLGTAFLPTKAEGYFPRVLLIDEIDKSDPDFPDDLLHVLEEGRFLITEIQRLGLPENAVVEANTSDSTRTRVPIASDGWIQCDDFPLVVMTSNRERDFSPAFLRRCLRLDICLNPIEIQGILEAHFKGKASSNEKDKLFRGFIEKLRKGEVLATDQLLNAFHLVKAGRFDADDAFIDATIMRSLVEEFTKGLDDAK
jgi:MoxR-like ATPase